MFAKLGVTDRDLTIYNALMSLRRHLPVSPCHLANLPTQLNLAEREGLIPLRYRASPQSFGLSVRLRITEPGFSSLLLDLPLVTVSPCPRVPFVSFKLAEREGFEPPDALRHRLISSQVQSTTLPSLRPIHKAHWRVLLKPIR